MGNTNCMRKPRDQIQTPNEEIVVLDKPKAFNKFDTITVNNEIEFMKLFQDMVDSSNKEDVESRLKRFFQQSSPLSTKTNGATYLALAMGMLQPQVVKCLIEKYRITRIQSPEPLTSFERFLQQDYDSPVVILKAFDDFNKNYRLNPDALRAKMFVEHFKKEGVSFDEIKGLEWVANSENDNVLNEDCFKKLEPKLQFKLYCASLRITTFRLDLVSTPIVQAISQGNPDAIEFLLSNPITNKLGLDVQQNNILHHFLNELLVSGKLWSSSHRLCEAMGRLKEKTIFFKQRNSKGQTPLMYLIRGGHGFPQNMEHAIRKTGKELPSALFALIREEVTKEFMASLKSLVSPVMVPKWKVNSYNIDSRELSPDLVPKWKEYGFDIGSMELALFTLIYKGLQCRYKELISKVYLSEIVSWM